MQALSPSAKPQELLPTRNPTIQDAIDFLRIYGHKETLKNWTDADIAASIKQSLLMNTFAFSVDKQHKLNGIVIATVNHDKQTVHVNTIALNGKKLLREYVKRFHDVFPEYKLTGERNGTLKRFIKLEEVA